jgi:hypothetical protein
VSRLVIAVFKPRHGMQQQLHAVVAKHWRVLQEQQLVTTRPRIVMQAGDGCVIEVFEWRSAQAIEQAHSNAAVLALWAEFETCCEYVPLALLAEAQHPFSEFAPLAL